MSDYAQAARSLALPIDDPPSPTATRASTESALFGARRSLSSSRGGPPTFKQRILQQTSSLHVRVQKTYSHLTPLQRILIALATVVLFVLGVLFLVYNERFFAALEPAAKRWRNTPGGWLILWAATFLVSFPPLIGYSSCITLAGFVYGVWKGWAVVASATILGSTASFILSRTLLKGFVERRTANDKRWAAVALTLKHDGIKLLVMIRLCPLPYSFSNGAIATIPTVQWPQFMAATAAASPKLLLHCFVGSRLGAIAQNGDKMDAGTKAISYLSIAIGATAGLATSWFMYTKTTARARELEAEEREAAIHGPRRQSQDEEQGGEYHYSDQYSDDSAERQAAHGIRQDDGISLHTAKADDEGEDEDEGYRDQWGDEGEDHDARSLDDVFQQGDGDDDDDEEYADR